MTSSGSNEVKKIINGLECDSKRILLGGKVILVPFLGQKVTHLSRILCLPARKSISPLITFLDRSLKSVQVMVCLHIFPIFSFLAKISKWTLVALILKYFKRTGGPLIVRFLRHQGTGLLGKLY